MKNRLKELLSSGKTAVGTIVQLPSAPVVEILAQAGFDWLVIDAEHGPIDIEKLHAMIRATGATPVTPVVRIASNVDWLTKHALDVGALGVMIPGVNSAAEAQAAVRAVRYPPQGIRGFGPTFAALRWGVSGAEYVRQANEAVAAIVQIEHIDAVRRIDEILAVPGIDVALIGPYDLSGSMGLLGEVAHPEVQAAIGRVLAAARKANVPAGIFGVAAEDIKRYVAQGFRAILAGVDVAFLAAGANSMLSQLGTSEPARP
jgi:4-hydroxy-2-oxoheptanedioate aldolase